LLTDICLNNPTKSLNNDKLASNKERHSKINQHNISYQLTVVGTIIVVLNLSVLFLVEVWPAANPEQLVF